MPRRGNHTTTILHTTVGSNRHQGHRRTHGGIKRDARRTEGRTGDARGTRRTGGKSRGIGAGRRATGTQHTRAGAVRAGTRPGTTQPCRCGRRHREKNRWGGSSIIVLGSTRGRTANYTGTWRCQRAAPGALEL
jgi:hypothetical protein